MNLSENTRTQSLDKDNMDQPKAAEPVADPAADSTETVKDDANSATVENNNQSSDSEDDRDFLKFTRTIPNADSSPSVPILKRKYDDITSDECTESSATNKRKRVSFHDPPVSTSVKIEVYRHKQKSLQDKKRPERRYSPEGVAPSPDGETGYITFDLNNEDPIFPPLIHCEDDINIIASKLSSEDGLPMLIKEMDGNISTVGGLAKLTEMELDKFSLRPPKLTTAKIALANYQGELYDKRFDANAEGMDITEQTVRLADGGMQTDENAVEEILSSINCTSRILHSSFVEQQYQEPLMEMYRKELQEKVFDKIPFNVVADLVRNKNMTDSDRSVILGEIIYDVDGLKLLKSHLLEKFSLAEIFQFCIQLLQELSQNIPSTLK